MNGLILGKRISSPTTSYYHQVKHKNIKHTVKIVVVYSIHSNSNIGALISRLGGIDVKKLCLHPISMFGGLLLVLSPTCT